MVSELGAIFFSSILVMHLLDLIPEKLLLLHLLLGGGLAVELSLIVVHVL